MVLGCYNRCCALFLLCLFDFDYQNRYDLMKKWVHNGKLQLTNDSRVEVVDLL
jgi:hypothetical protein